MRSGVALVLLTGCELVFPLPDREPLPRVNGTFLRRSAAPEVTDVPAVGAGIQIRFETGETIDLVVDADGAFSFEKLTETYALISELNLNQAELIESANQLSLAGLAAGRETTPVIEETPIEFTVPAAAFTFSTTGQWTSQSIDTATFDWRDAAPTGGLPIGVLDGDRGDRVVLSINGLGAFKPGQTAIAAVAVDDNVKMIEGQMLDLTALALAPTDQNTCVTAGLRLGPELERLQTVSGPAFDRPAGGVGVTSIPSFETFVIGGVGLMSVVLPQQAPATPPAVDADLDIPGHDPFGQRTLVSAVVAAARDAKIGSSGTLPLTNGVTTFAKGDRGACPENRVAFDPQRPGLAIDIALDATPLDADDREIAITRPGSAVVTWKTEGPADFFDVTLIEVIPNGSVFTLDRRRVFRTREPRVAIDDTLLIPKRRYLLQVSSSLGFPNVASGDYVTMEYPLVNALMNSATFIAQ